MKYTVKEDDGLAKVAWQHGLDPETVWDHPDNEHLRDERNDPEILAEGDELFLPEKQQRSETGATDQRHRFVVSSVPVTFRIRFTHNDEPRTALPYMLTVHGVTHTGTTDADGALVATVPPDAVEGTLELGETKELFHIQFSKMQPVDTTKGLQDRLRNLGYYAGLVDGVLSPETKGSLSAFLADHTDKEGDQDPSLGGEEDLLEKLHRS